MKFHTRRAQGAVVVCAAGLAVSGCSTPQATERPSNPPPYREVPAPGYGFGDAGGYQPARPSARAASQAGEVRSIEAPRRATQATEGRPRGAADGPWRIVVRLDDGTHRAFESGQPSDWRVGDRVRVVDNRLVRK